MDASKGQGPEDASPKGRIRIELTPDEALEGLSTEGRGGFARRLLGLASLRSPESQVVSYTGRFDEAVQDVPWLENCRDSLRSIIPQAVIRGEERYQPTFSPVEDRERVWDLKALHPHFGYYHLTVTEDGASLALSGLNTTFRKPAPDPSDPIYSYYIERANSAAGQVRGLEGASDFTATLEVQREEGRNDVYRSPYSIEFEFKDLPPNAASVQFFAAMLQMSPLNCLDNQEHKLCEEGAKDKNLVAAVHILLCENLTKVPSKVKLSLPL